MVGSSPDGRGIYIADNTLFYCKNDLVFPCDAVSGVPTIGSVPARIISVQFLTRSLVYLVTETNTASGTYRCNVDTLTNLSDCRTVFSEQGRLQVLEYPANNGLNAYITETDFNQLTMNLKICDVNQVSGTFDNCGIVFDGLAYVPLKPILSLPIVF